MSILQRLRKDERGEVNLAYILIVALIVIPLLYLLISMRNKTEDLGRESFTETFSSGDRGLKGVDD
jgi:hypothetical protein